MPPSTRTLFWVPTAQDIEDAADTKFRHYVNKKHGRSLRDYDELHAYSLEDLNRFWTDAYEYTGVIGDRTCVHSHRCGPAPLSEGADE